MLAAATASELTAETQGKDEGIEIPATALFSGDEPNKSFVWIVDAATKTLSRREVQLGDLARYGVLIKSGVNAGEWIVTNGVHTLEEGQKVQIMDRNGQGKAS